MMFLLFLSTQISLFSIMISHPLNLSIALLIQSISFSMIIGVMMTNFWYAYMFFLMMISGMLILFMYMTSIASNKKFNLSMYTIILMMTSMLLMAMIMMYSYNKSMTNYMFSLTPSINLMFNIPLTMMMISMIIYLLLTLIATVKIINTNMGPLRQKF